MASPLATDQPDRTVEANARATAGRFLLARLGSLFALLPVGVWTTNHLWNSLAAFDSPEAWQSAVTGYGSTATAALTMVLVLGPLLWHTVWGIVRIARSRPSPDLSRFSNVRYIVQRLAAIGLLLFLGAHLWLAWAQPRFFQGRPEPFADIAHEMRHYWPTTAVYVLGVLAIAYHLANGLWSFAMGWGLAVSKSALAWAERLAIVVFIALLAIGWAAVYALWLAGA